MTIKRSLTLLALTFYASTSLAATLVDVADQGLPRLKSADYQLKEIKQITDQSGNTHIRYEQTYQGIPVYGHQIIQHTYQPTVAPRGIALSPYTGTMVQDIEQDLSEQARFATSNPQATLDSLKIKYANEKGLPYDRLVFENEFAREVIYIDDKDQAHIAHEVNFFVDIPDGGAPARPYYVVDVATSAVLKTWNGLAHERIGTGPGGNERTGFYQYGKDYPALDISKSRGRCTYSSEAGKSVDMNNRMGKSTTAYSYICRRGTNQEADAVNGAASPLNDAQYFIDVLTRFYTERYRSAPVPFPLIMRTHYGNNFANAFWNGSSMTYGDGNNDLYPFVVLDISAHEIAHGFTEHNSGLIYEGQSGGINESYSDMASRAIEYFAYGVHDWNLGGDIFKDPKVTGLRYMDNPSRDGKSIEHASQYNDTLDVHYSSGVFNKAFYLLSTTPGWNTGIAFDVMYYANAGYWQSNSNFAKAAWGVVQSAAANGRNVDDVITVFGRVGISCDKVQAKCT